MTPAEQEIHRLSEERQRIWREKDGSYLRPGYEEWLQKRLRDAYADKRRERAKKNHGR